MTRLAVPPTGARGEGREFIQPVGKALLGQAGAHRVPGGEFYYRSGKALFGRALLRELHCGGTIPGSGPTSIKMQSRATLIASKIWGRRKKISSRVTWMISLISGCQGLRRQRLTPQKPCQPMVLVRCPRRPTGETLTPILRYPQRVCAHYFAGVVSAVRVPLPATRARQPQWHYRRRIAQHFDGGDSPPLQLVAHAVNQPAVSGAAIRDPSTR